ncbi:zinc finger protein 525 isoform X2 [Patella vulgata]|uniref:zinc finger protein 525 isoform X2 n=1 Tax=Patella vulgata TaxID=6465 RepID=UPI0021801259|nr:zinc finger protein 525 isoform X2 [Patella vulgata]
MLREQYLRLENQLACLETKYRQALAACEKGKNDFITRLLKTVGNLFNNLQYSDLRVLLEGGYHLNCHKFIFFARSDKWGVGIDDICVEELDLSDIKYEVAYVMIRWVYTDEFDTDVDDTFIIDLLGASQRYNLQSLSNRCEKVLMTFVDEANCEQYLSLAREKEIRAVLLDKFCAKFIKNHTDHDVANETKKVQVDSVHTATDSMEKTELSACENEDFVEDDTITETLSTDHSESVMLYVMDEQLNNKLSPNQQNITVSENNDLNVVEEQASETDDVTGSINVDKIASTSVMDKCEANIDDEVSIDYEGGNDENTFEIDNREIKQKKIHKCDICQKILKHAYLLNEHRWLHTGEKPFKCKYCSKRFRSQGTLTEHIRIHTREKRYKCDVCDLSFISSTTRRVHKRLHVNPKPHVCSYCYRSFMSVDKLDNHVKTHTSLDSFKCDSCEETFSTKASLARHVVKLHTEKPHSCHICGKSYARVCNLNLHIESHTGINPAPYDFVPKAIRVYDERTDTSRLMYQCDYCDQKKYSMVALNEHLRIHNGVKPFKCDICDKSFTFVRQLKPHLRMHSGERPYRCEECDKSFTSSMYLQRHRKTHSTDKQYQCDLCGKAFSLMIYLTKHVKKVHV